MRFTIGPGAPCPCGSGRPFAVCCEPLLRGDRVAATARELMRSRYTAHAVGDDRYLHRTYVATARKPFVAAPAQPEAITWTRLVIHGDEPGPTPDQAFVEFSAFYRDRAGEHEHHERSEFRRADGAWLYTRAVPKRSGRA